MSSESSTSEAFNPRRLRLARERKGLTKESFAAACDVTRRAVSDWEAGRVERPPTAKIAEALNFPESFFYLDDWDETPEDAVSFRALSAMSRRQVGKVLASSVLVREFSRWVENRYRTPTPDIPPIDELVICEDLLEPSPVEAARALRSIWSLGVGPIADLMALLESRGVYVFALAGDDKEVDAFSFWQDGRPYIFVNVSKSAERVRFDLAHELGHLCMHRGVAIAKNRGFELQANTFASCFLVPDAGLLPQIKRAPRLEDVVTLKKYWRVSATAMIRRLFQLGRISEWQYRSWMIDYSRRGFRSSEPDGLPHEQSSLLRQVLALAREDGWTIRKISSRLSLPTYELTSALMGLTIASAAEAAVSGPPAPPELSIGRPRLRSVQ